VGDLPFPFFLLVNAHVVWEYFKAFKGSLQLLLQL